MMNLKSLALFFLVLIFQSCASSSKARVIETESGVLQSISSAKEEPDARISALDAATEYCEDQDKKPIFRDKNLRSEGKKDGLALKRLPIIGEAFKGDEKTQVLLQFRCSDRSVPAE